MQFITGFAIYFVIWWVTLFIVLPYGNRSQAEDGEIIMGTDPGAPTKSNLLMKLFVNSIVAALVFCAYWYLTDYFNFDFSDIPNIIPDHSEPPQ
ncbi:MAG: DUF1467 family protein [Pseudomonadota bacterium]